MASSSLPQNALDYFDELKSTGQSLSIVVIGDPGSGKTCLVNSLLEEEIAEEEIAEEVNQSTSPISTFTGTVQGVSVTVYEVRGLSVEDEQHQGEFRKLIQSDSQTFVLYCFKLSETRMRQSIIKDFKFFHSAGINWSKTVIALTFADSLPVPRTQRQDPNFDEKLFFINRVKEFREKINKVLTMEVGIATEATGCIAMLPTTGETDEMLPTGEEWCSPLWSAVLATRMHTDTQNSSVGQLPGHNFMCIPGATGNNDVEENTRTEATAKLIGRTSVSFTASGQYNGEQPLRGDYQAVQTSHAEDHTATYCSCTSCCML